MTSDIHYEHGAALIACSDWFRGQDGTSKLVLRLVRQAMWEGDHYYCAPDGICYCSKRCAQEKDWNR